MDLDHADESPPPPAPPRYLGLSHHSPCRTCRQRCNQSAGAAKKIAMYGQTPATRRCVICGMPFTVHHHAEQVTCGKSKCITEIRRVRKARRPDPVPPAAQGWTL
jgi:hypothetical protein